MRKYFILSSLILAMLFAIVGCDKAGMVAAPSVSTETVEDTVPTESVKSEIVAVAAAQKSAGTAVRRTATVARRTTEVRHTVRRGETCGKIARRYNVTVQNIVNRNKLRNANLIRVGQVLTIPVPGANASAPRVEPTRRTNSRPFVLDFRNNSASELIEALSYMRSPMRGRGVTSANGQLPNAPRRYRNGFHEGLDYYGVSRNAPVLAAADGVVIRADHDFVEMTLAEYNENIRIAKAARITPEPILDKLRGKQIWIEHADGVVTRYCHLESIQRNVTVGARVSRGQHIGGVGKTGMKSNIIGRVTNPSGEPHLHFEVWHRGVFLGQGRPVNQVRTIYSKIFR